MIYIVEIPHQRPASCWTAHTEQQAVNAINESAIRNGETFETFGSAVEYLESDLSSLIACGSDEGALACLADESMWQRHGGAAARNALRDKMVRHGLIDDEPDHV